MSFAFDTLSQAWATLRQRLPEDVQSAELTMRFEFLLEELHEANHRLGDAVNKDQRVSSLAVRLSRCPPLPEQKPFGAGEAEYDDRQYNGMVERAERAEAKAASLEQQLAAERDDREGVEQVLGACQEGNRELAAQIELLRRDGERRNWMEANWYRLVDLVMKNKEPNENMLQWSDRIYAAIDAAIAARGGEGGNKITPVYAR